VRSLGAAQYEMVESERLRHHRASGFNGDADLFAFGPRYPHTQRDIAELKRLDF
jgi:hypothetical protein